MSELNFNAANVEPDTGTPDPIPGGWYNAMADQSELKPTKDGVGARLSVRFTVLDGQYAGRKVFAGFNIKNANAVAQEIAYKQLSALAHAVGVLDVKTSEMLHNIPLKIKVKVKPADGVYEAQNEVTIYKNIKDDAGGSAVGSAPSASVPSAPAGFGAPVAPAAPSAPAPIQAPAPAPAPVKQMTSKAQATYEAYIAAGWSDSALIEHGLMVAPVVPAPAPAVPGPAAPAWSGAPAQAQPWETPQASAPSAPPSAPTAPPAPSAPVNPASVAQVAVPPWQQ